MDFSWVPAYDLPFDPFGYAQDLPFDPFGYAQDRPFDPFGYAQDRQGSLRPAQGGQGRQGFGRFLDNKKLIL